MGELELNYSADAVRVIFNDAFSYHLKFLWGHRIPTMKEHGDHAGNLQATLLRLKCGCGSPLTVHCWIFLLVSFYFCIRATCVYDVESKGLSWRETDLGEASAGHRNACFMNISLRFLSLFFSQKTHREGFP